MHVTDESYPHGYTINSQNKIIIDNCQFTGDILRILRCSNVTIRNCTFNGNSGIFAWNTVNIIVEHCQFDITALHAVQYHTCSGICQITQCTFKGSGPISDMINIQQCIGTRTSPILIDFNDFQGGGNLSCSGAIAIGDRGGSWQTVRQNTIHMPGQYGIGILGGQHLLVTQNSIENDAPSPTARVGLYVWDISSVIANVDIIDNTILFNDYLGNASPLWIANTAAHAVKTRNNRLGGLPA